MRMGSIREAADQKSRNSNSSASVGISFGTDGFLINVGASGGRGKADGQDGFREAVLCLVVCGA